MKVDLTYGFNIDFKVLSEDDEEIYCKFLAGPNLFISDFLVVGATYEITDMRSNSEVSLTVKELDLKNGLDFVLSGTVVFIKRF